MRRRSVAQARQSEPRQSEPRQSEPRFDMNVLAAGASETEDGSTFARNEIPLNGFPKEIHERVRMLEAMAWRDHLLLYHRQRTLAVKLTTRPWPTNPLP